MSKKKKKEAAMDEYHLMADFFSTWRSMNDTTKNTFIIGFYATIIMCLFCRYWLRDWLEHRQAIRGLVMEKERQRLARDRADVD